jgi:hypothetical protein
MREQDQTYEETVTEICVDTELGDPYNIRCT